MTNKELWEQYKDYSQLTSDIARKIGFAGIAICWIFHAPGYTFSSKILLVLILLIFFFLFDLLQYLTTTIILRIWIRKKEVKMWESTGEIEGNYLKPLWIDRPALICFVLKLLALISAYVALGIRLFVY